MASGATLFILYTLLNSANCGDPISAADETISCMHESCTVKTSQNVLVETDGQSKAQKIAEYIFILVMIVATWEIWKRYKDGKDAHSKEDTEDFSDPIRYGNRLIYPGDWIRSLNGMEILFAIGGMRNLYGSNYAVWLRSKKPIDEKVMMAALTAVTRQYPVLQMCFQFRYSGIGFKRVSKMKVDFTTITGDPFLEFKKRLTFKINRSQGPLWRATLVKCPNIADQPNNRNFQSTLILNCCHSITDATTNNLAFRETIRFYNEITSGQSIILYPPTFSRPVWNQYSSRSFMEIIFRNSKTLYDVFCGKFNVQCIAPRSIDKREHKWLYDNITKDETAKVKDLCKGENISINSFITTAFSMAFVQTVCMFSGSVIQKMDLTIGHIVNLRQFAKWDRDKLYGCYTTSLNALSKIDLQKKEEFWIEAKRLNADIRLKINNNDALKSISDWKYIALSQLIPDFRQFFCSQDFCSFHALASNMGDVSGQLPPGRENDCVEIYDLQRSVSGAACFTPLMLNYETFRNIMKFSIDIRTNLINEECAQYLFATFMNTIKVICRDGALSS